LPKGWVQQAKDTIKEIEKCQFEYETLLVKNRIFVRRMVGAGPIDKEDAINWGFTGPCLRAAGVPYDLRVSSPYYKYADLEFDVPIGERGDSYDRFMVRQEEVRQSIRILHQLLDNI